MTTKTLTRPQTEMGVGMPHGRCPGCPRCQSDAGFCPLVHMGKAGNRSMRNRHPICHTCGHCVLRGLHNDDTSDLTGET